jgi:RNA polymerase sigma-70 factor, ECF subfamily
MHRDLVDSLFARYREPVYRFLRRMLRDEAAAEDLTQDTFLRALAGPYQANGNERAWIFQVARNLARDRSRAHGRRPVLVELDDRGLPASDPSLALAIDGALAQLGDDDREVFLLREVGGLSYAEIGAACGLTADAVRSRLHRARLALRAALGPAERHDQGRTT